MTTRQAGEDGTIWEKRWILLKDTVQHRAVSMTRAGNWVLLESGAQVI